MATSRVMSADANARLTVPGLIPAAGSWTKVSSHPASGGAQWMAVSGGLTARRERHVRDATDVELRARPGTQDRGRGNLPKQANRPLLRSERLATAGPQPGSIRFAPRPHTVMEKNVIERDWHKQRREMRRSAAPPHRRPASRPLDHAARACAAAHGLTRFLHASSSHGASSWTGPKHFRKGHARWGPSAGASPLPPPPLPATRPLSP